jgi:hypothetical protein
MIKPIATLDDILHRATGAGSCSRPGISTFRSAKKWACAFSSTPDKNLLPPCRKPATRIRTIRCLPEVCFLATLTGWGLIWLMLRERHLGGTIILADAHIRYSAAD